MNLNRRPFGKTIYIYIWLYYFVDVTIFLSFFFFSPFKYSLLNLINYNPKSLALNNNEKMIWYIY